MADLVWRKPEDIETLKQFYKQTRRGVLADL